MAQMVIVMKLQRLKHSPLQWGTLMRKVTRLCGRRLDGHSIVQICRLLHQLLINAGNAVGLHLYLWTALQ